MNRAALVMAFALGVLGCTERSGRIPSVGTLERDRIDLVADSNEPIVRIAVREGDAVTVGDLLVQQDVQRPQAQLERALAQVSVARAKLEEAEKGPRTQQIQQGRARLAAAKSAVLTVRQELDRLASLKELNFASQGRIDSLQGRHDELVARRDEADAALDELLEGTRGEAIDQARSAYAAAAATARDLEITVARAAITAPVDGVVEAVLNELGERPVQNMSVVILRASEPTYARVHVPQPLRTRIRAGDSAEVHIDGYAAPFAARVRWISSEAAFTPYFALTQYDRSRLSYAAEIDLLSPDAHRIPAGIPVEVYFARIDE